MTTRTPRPKDNYRLERVDNEILLYHPVKTTTLYLNESAALIWRLCDGQRSSGDISTLLREAFPDGAATIDEEVETTLNELADQGVIEFV